MPGLFKKNKAINIRLPKSITKAINNLKQNTNSPFLIGLLNGFMPCGPLQSMQLYALGTGSFIQGALSMFIFALGIFPLMLGLSNASSFLSGKMGVKLKKLSGVLVVILGIVMFNRGFDYSIFDRLTIPNINLNGVTVATIKDGDQEVTTRFTNGRYKPIVVQKGMPVKWTIIIEGGDLYGCNNAIEIKEYNITKKLDYGNNLVTFIPSKTGTFKYTCWMHMLSSTIYVVENINSLKE